MMENKKISNKIVVLLLLLALAWLMPLTTIAQNHWVPQSAAYEDNMTLTGIILINGVEQQTTALEVGAFCGEECRGAMRPVLFPPTQQYVVQMTIYGNDGDYIIFRLYDHDLGEELNVLPSNGIFFSSTSYGGLMSPYELNFLPIVSVTATSSPEGAGTVSGMGEYATGSTCTMTATPNENYCFYYWTENGEVVSTDASYSFVVTGNRTLVGVFGLPLTISVETNPVEGGTITGAGEYNYNTNCTLIATPNAGYYFTHWMQGNVVVSTSPTYTFNVTDNVTYSAVFTPIPQYTITAVANPVMGGTITGEGTYYEGSTCTLTVTANSGYVFSHWKKGDVVVSLNASYSFTVTESSTFEAVLIEGLRIGAGEATNQYLPSYSYYKYTLSQQIYTSDEIGSNGIIDRISFYNAGTTKTRNYDIYLVHTEKTVFEGKNDWIIVAESDRVFSGDVTMNQNEWTTIFLDVPFFYNGTSNLAIVVDDNSGNWSSNDMTCRVFNANGNQAIRVYSDNPNYDPFNPGSYNGTLHNVKNQIILGFNTDYRLITVSANPVEGGTVSGGGNYLLGETCRVTAIPNENYAFINWTENGEVVSTEDTYSFTVSGDRTLVANFSLQQFDVIVSALPEAGGAVTGGGTYTYGQSCAITATANEGYTFTNWTENGNVVSTEAAYSFIVSGDRTLVANFSLQQFDIAVSALPEEGGFVTGGGTYSYGQSCTIIATVNEGYTFANWTENGEVISSEATYTFTVAGDRNLVANFEQNASYYPISLSDDFNDGVIDPVLWTYTGNSVLEEEGLLKLQQNVTDQDVHLRSINLSIPADGKVDLGRKFMVHRACDYYNGRNTIQLNGDPDSFIQIEYVYTLYYDNAYQSAPKTGVYLITKLDGVESEIRLCDINFDTWLIENVEVDFTAGTLSYNMNSSDTTVTIPGFVEQTVNHYNVEYGPWGWWTGHYHYMDYVKINVSQGALAGLFSVSENTQVNFSQGNLQYQASTNTWRFSENQWDFVGGDNSNISSTYDGWIDLFGWGTSGYNHGAVCYQPWSTSQTASDYYAYGSSSYNLYDQTGQADWGYNTIINGGNTENNGWRTLTRSEWNYVCNTRTTTSNIRYALAKVNDVFGIILLPDDWDISIYTLNYINGDDSGFDIISATEWTDVFESNGAVFLPAAGYRWGTQVYHPGEDGWYWSSSWHYDHTDDYGYLEAYLVSFGYEDQIQYIQSVDEGTNSRIVGGSVRLVRSAQNVTYGINATPIPAEGGSIEGAGAYEEGSTCTLIATANEDYTFMYWTENGNQVSADATYSFTVTDNRELVAHFALPFAITATASPTEGGTINGAGEYDYGSTCTLTATPNDGYLFLHWSRNGSVVSCNASYSFTVTENVTLEAAFGQIEGMLVGNGELTNQYLPSYSYYKYTLSQQIYTPDEIGAAGSITAISYYNAGATKTRNYDIYMVYTDKTVFENKTDWITVTESDRIFSGTVTMNEGGWITFILDTPFIYDGTSNLAIIVDDNSGNWTNQPHMACRVFNANGNQALRVYNDGTNYDPSNPSDYNGTLHSVKNQMILKKTHTVMANANLAEEGFVEGAGVFNYGSICTLTATANEGFVFVNWMENGEMVSTESVYSFTVTGNRDLVANFVQLCSSICDDFNDGIINPEYWFWSGSDVYETDGLMKIEQNNTDGKTILHSTSLSIPNDNQIIIDRKFMVHRDNSWTWNDYCENTVLFNGDENSYVGLRYYNDIAGIGGAKNGTYIVSQLDGEYVEMYLCDAQFDTWLLESVVINLSTGSLDYYLNYNLLGSIEVPTLADLQVNYYCLKFSPFGWHTGHYHYMDYININANVSNRMIVVSANLNEAGVITGAGEHEYGSVCTLTAIPNEGYEFQYWAENGETITTEPSFSFIVMADRSLVAHFVPTRQTFNLSPGWSWLSTYVEQDGIDGLSMLEEGLDENGVMIKSQYDGFVSYNAGSWMGSLNGITNEKMYLVNTSNPSEVIITGPPAQLGEHSITLSPNWNWIGYPSPYEKDVNEALSNLTATEGDVLKSQSCFAIYNAMYGWYGSLNTMTPGMGFMYQSHNSEDVTLTYSDGMSRSLKRNVEVGNNHWVPTIEAYPQNMNVVAIVELNGEEVRDEYYELAVFSGEECRGSVRLVYVEPLHRHVAFLSVSGEEEAELQLALYDKQTGKVYFNATDGLRFVANAVLGDLDSPYVARFGSMGLDENDAETIAFYPNPVRAGQLFQIELPAECSGVRVSIVNALGAVVSTTDLYAHPATLRAPSVAGVYLLRIVTDKGIAYCRKLVVKN